MVKSKRNTVVTLTKVKKNVNKKHRKEERLEQFKRFLNTPNIYIYVIDVKNYSNSNLKEMIEYFKPNGKLFYGKNKLMKKALVTKEGNELKQNFNQIYDLLTGNRILLCTDDSPLKVLKFLNTFRPEEYIKAGNISSKTIILKAGTVLNVPTSMQKDLQEKKLNFDIVDQKIVIREDRIVAEENKIISVENAKLLRMLNIKIGTFDMTVLGYWNQDQFISLM